CCHLGHPTQLTLFTSWKMNMVLFIDPQRFQVEFLVLKSTARLAFLVPECRPQRCDRFEEVETGESDDDYEVFTPPSDVDRIGRVLYENEDDCIEMSMKEVKDCISHKEGLIVEGIEIRPRIG
ncbi:hypothetical protein EJD97_017518, partial [Solanum chilense]